MSEKGTLDMRLHLLSQAPGGTRLVVLRVPVQKLEAGELVLDAGASRYVARVHRLRAGDQVVLFQPKEAREAEATIVEVARDAVRCRVGEVRTAKVRAERRVTLVQGAPKGDKLDAIVRDATELGATAVVVAETQRSVVRFAEKRGDRFERLRRIAAEAARQSGRGDTPSIVGPLAWSDALATESDPHAAKLCLWERATEPAGRRLARLAPDQPLVIAAGPEGGLESAEAEAARALGYDVVSLGPFILRTETVAAAVLGAVLLKIEEVPE
jgi:16S rRNA (uracil1498-N3)-methyltransferase